MTLKQLRNKYKEAYKQLPKNIYCKCLNATIKKTKSGFEHVFTDKINRELYEDRQKLAFNNYKASLFDYLVFILTTHQPQTVEKRIKIDEIFEAGLSKDIPKYYFD